MPPTDTQYPYRVVANHNARIIVQDEKQVTLRCVARRKLGTLVAGDWVAVERAERGDAVVVAVAARSSVLERPDRRGVAKPVAANLSRLLVVAAIKPGLQTLLIDSYCAAAERAGIEPVLIINKSDLLDKNSAAETSALLQTYRQIGLHCEYISTQQKTGLENLSALLADHTCVLVGQSGVGKSSLVNCLLPQQAVRTGSLSERGLGAHTTTATTLYNLVSGGSLIDSPGVRDFALGKILPAELASAFREFAEFSHACRFANCVHQSEPGCAVKQAVEESNIARSRYLNYVELLEKNI